MEKTYLGREDAPVSAGTWKLLDTAMIEAAKSQLSGRRLISIDGPFGFGLKVIPLSDCEVADGISGSPFVPVNLVSTTFFLGKRDLAAVERDRLFLDADPVACAAMACAAKLAQLHQRLCMALLILRQTQLQLRQGHDLEGPIPAFSGMLNAGNPIGHHALDKIDRLAMSVDIEPAPIDIDRRSRIDPALLLDMGRIDDGVRIDRALM